MTENDFSGASCNRASDISSIVARMLRSRISREIAPETYGFLDTKEQLGRGFFPFGNWYTYGRNAYGGHGCSVSYTRKNDNIFLAGL